MIIEETVTINDREFVKTYSDEGFYIIQDGTGAKYSEAVDIPNKYTYSESEEKIITEQETKPTAETLKEENN